jgi:hypothetical protein
MRMLSRGDVALGDVDLLVRRRPDRVNNGEGACQ